MPEMKDMLKNPPQTDEQQKKTADEILAKIKAADDERRQKRDEPKAPARSYTASRF